MCNKNAYRTKSDAKEDIKRMEGNSKRSAGMSKNLRKLRPYKCFYCKMWHTTSQPKAEERRIRKSKIV